MWSFAKQISGFKILKNNIWEYDEAESEIWVKRCIIGLSPIVAATRPKVYRYDIVEKSPRNLKALIKFWAEKLQLFHNTRITSDSWQTEFHFYRVSQKKIGFRKIEFPLIIWPFRGKCKVINGVYASDNKLWTCGKNLVME